MLPKFLSVDKKNNRTIEAIKANNAGYCLQFLKRTFSSCSNIIYLFILGYKNKEHSCCCFVLEENTDLKCSTVSDLDLSPWYSNLDIMMAYCHIKDEVSRSVVNSQNQRKFKFFDCHDLDLKIMTLTLKINLHIVDIYWHIKIEVNSSSGSKVISWKHMSQSDQVSMKSRSMNS